MFAAAGAVGQLINWLAKLPGIGRKSATRLAFHILKMPADDAREFARLIGEVKDAVGFCSTCCNIAESDPCALCADPRRVDDKICVVEEPMDVAALAKAESFNGRFHVLNGRLSPLDGIGPDDLKIAELMKRMSEDVSEVIIATNPNVEGEATAAYLSRLIKPLGIAVTRIARGLPVGSDLEYADSLTLSRALEGRQEF